MANEPTKAVTDALITGDELLAMGDIGPCGLVEGMPVVPWQRCASLVRRRA